MHDEYWQHVEPVWDRISIADGGGTFLRQFAKATDKQKVLFASHWAQLEIMNGGLGQFFDNPTGVLGPEAAWAFEQLRMPKCADILRQAMSFFGSPYPRERAARQECAKTFFRDFGEKEIPLLALEDAIADELEVENGGFWAAANQYAQDH